MIDRAAVHDLVTSWWFDYDQGNFAAWAPYFTADARFTCRSDSGATAFEEFITADVTGRDALLGWQENHRRSSPYPLRHHGTNIHVSTTDDRVARFRSYLFVTQIAGGAVVNLSTGIVHGAVREEGGALRIAELHVVLDYTESELFGPGARPPVI